MGVNLPNVSQAEFLRAIWGEQNGWAELGVGIPNPQDPTKTIDFYGLAYEYPTQLQEFLNDTELPHRKGKLNLYFGVCLRNRPWSKGRGSIEMALSATCLWVDIDFKNISEDEARKRLKSFPFPASVGTLSGGGIQAFWLLKEPVVGENLKKFSDLNKRLAKALGGDHTQDLARVLRIPGTLNVKYVPPREARVCVWRPERKYLLDDFEFLPAIHLPSPPISPHEATSAPARSVPPPADAIPSVEVGELPVPEVVKKIIREGLPAFIEHRRNTDVPQKFEERQKSNQLSRSEADAFVITKLVYANVSDAEIYGIYRDPKNKIGEKYREKKGGDKYLGLTIRKAKGYKEKNPRISPDKVAERVGEYMEKSHGDLKFELLKLVKWDYEEPVWDVVIKLKDTGEELITRCQHKDFSRFSRFNEGPFCAQQASLLTYIKQNRWAGMINEAQVEVKVVEKEVGTTEGEILEALDEWLAEAHTEPNEATIQYLPIAIPEENKIYLRVRAFMQYLEKEKIDAKKRLIIHCLKSQGFGPGTHKFGKRAMKVWAGPLHNGNGNGHAPHDPGPEPKAPPPKTGRRQKLLFDTPEAEAEATGDQDD